MKRRSSWNAKVVKTGKEGPKATRHAENKNGNVSPIWVITFNVSDLLLIKRHRLNGSKKKQQHQTICYVRETLFGSKATHRLEVRRWKKRRICANGDPQGVRMTIPLPVKEASIYGIMRKKISKETGNLNNTTEQRHLAGIMYRTFYH